VKIFEKTRKCSKKKKKGKKEGTKKDVQEAK